MNVEFIPYTLKSGKHVMCHASYESEKANFTGSKTRSVTGHADSDVKAAREVVHRLRELNCFSA